MSECEEISSCYQKWYAALVEQFVRRRDELLGHFAPELVAYAEDYYRSMLEAIERRRLGRRNRLRPSHVASRVSNGALPKATPTGNITSEMTRARGPHKRES